MKNIFICLIGVIVFASNPAFASIHHHAKMLGSHLTKLHTKHKITHKTHHIKTIVDINTATIAQLSALNGIGPKKAKAIFAYRNTHGSFKKIKDLAQVKGIGPKAVKRILKKNQGYITANTH